MTSISSSSVNSAALLILQRASPSNGPAQNAGGEADILKIANGISSEPSEGKKSAAAAIGKFAVDTAPAVGRIVIGGLGSADSWEELRELVINNDKFSDSEKKKWLAEIDETEKMFLDIEEFRDSELYKSMTSGAIAEEFKALNAEAKDGLARHSTTVGEMNKFLVSQGREKIPMPV